MPTTNHLGLPVSADTRAAIDRLRGLATGFLRWWRAELLALIPERLRQLSRHEGQLVLMLDDASASVSLETAETSTVLARFAEPESAEARTAVQAVLQQPEVADRVGRGEIGLCLRLPSRYAVCRTIELPLAADSNLSEVIGFELDRYTPFRAEQVYFCHRVLTRDPAAQRIAVEITVVPRPIVDGAMRTAGGLGWAAEWVDVADPGPGAIHSDNLLAAAAPAGRRAGSRATAGLAAVAAALTLTALAIPFATEERQAAAMREEAAAVAKQAQTAAALKKEIEALRDGEDFLIGRKLRSPTVSRVLAEITHLLPDNTWLTDIRITGTDVELTGTSASASALIGILEQSGRFRGTSFRSPVIPDQRSGRERFSIAAHIVEEPRR